jgi:hypothetical protein
MKALTVIPLKAGSAELSDVDEPPESDGPCWWRPWRRDLRHGHRDPLGRLRVGPARARAPGARSRVARPRPRGAGRGAGEKGDLVVGIVRRPDPVPCANCAVLEWDFCRNGQYTERGIKEHDGYLSERYRITPDFVVKVDPSLGILGVLLEPTSVVAKAWEEVDRVGGRAHWDPKTVLVTGAGPDRPAGRAHRRPARLDVHVIDQMSHGVKPDLVRDLGATYHTGPWPMPCPGPT